MAKLTDEFQKRWDNYGFTLKEAYAKKHLVDECYGVERSNAKWNPATVVPDILMGGYKVVISTK